jgi:CRP/FNR family transcriptional regulator, cyclic AMP receptor protein
MYWIDFLGYGASLSVLATFCMNTMIPLRAIALGSNVLFCLYGAAAHIYPVLVLHAVLFPINAFRLIQLRRLMSEIRAARKSELSLNSLLPFMRRREVSANTILIKKSDTADCLYYLSEGTVEMPDLGKVFESGSVVGEIGVFSKDHSRTATVVCCTDCVVYELSESIAKQIYFQDKTFGFAMMQLVIVHLLEDDRRRSAPNAALHVSV